MKESSFAIGAYIGTMLAVVVGLALSPVLM